MCEYEGVRQVPLRLTLIYNITTRTRMLLSIVAYQSFPILEWDGLILEWDGLILEWDGLILEWDGLINRARTFLPVVIGACHRGTGAIYKPVHYYIWSMMPEEVCCVC